MSSEAKPDELPPRRLLVSLLVALCFIGINAYSSTAAPNSAYPGPNEGNPTAIPQHSTYALQAIEQVAKEHNLDTESLRIATDEAVSLPNLGATYQSVAVIDERPGGTVYKVFVDVNNGGVHEDVQAIFAAEATAARKRYGNLTPTLSLELEKSSDEAILRVAIWATALPGQSLSEMQTEAVTAVADHFPEARNIASFDKPMNVADPKLAAQIEAEYRGIIQQSADIRMRGLISEFETSKKPFVTFPGMPCIVVSLSKSEILALANRGDIASIGLANGKAGESLNVVVPAIGANAVWSSGIQGSGTSIAIVETYNVNPAVYVTVGATRPSPYGYGDDHANVVANVAAGSHPQFSGIASAATIISAGSDGTEVDTIESLRWALVDQHASVANYSAHFLQDEILHWSDVAFDYWARVSNRLIVVAADNTGGNVASPGKGWNVLTVGGSDDRATVDWGDDGMYALTSYLNPSSPHQDREKPEVVTYGVTITAPHNVGLLNGYVGTSVAAPQVAGLGALLVDRDSSLLYWPEAQRAIIMASALHNFDGPAWIVGNTDLKDGAGQVSAVFADQIAQVRGGPSVPCPGSCWWGDLITDVNLPVGNTLSRTFSVSSPSLVRVVISWWSRVDSPSWSGIDTLDTDLDLRVTDPNGNWVPGAESISYDNNYEMVQFLALAPGTYSINIKKNWADESANSVGTAVFVYPMSQRVWLPVLAKTDDPEIPQQLTITPPYPGPIEQTSTPTTVASPTWTRTATLSPSPTFTSTPSRTPTRTATPTATSTSTSTALSGGCPGNTLVANGCFETGTLSGWSAQGSPSTTTGAKRTGTYGLALPDGARVDQSFTTVLGQQYTASAWLRIDGQSGSDWGGLRLRVADSSWNTLADSGYQTTANSPVGTWKQLTLTFTATGTTTRILMEDFSGPALVLVSSWDEAVVTANGGGSPTPTPTATRTPTRTPTTTATTASGGCPGNTLAVNGCFETGTTSGWSVSGSPSVTTGAKHTGTYGLSIPDNDRVDQTFNTVIGQQYTVTAWLRIDGQSGSDWGGLRLRVTDSAWNTLADSGYQTTANSPLGVWKQLTFTFTATTTTSRILLEDFSGSALVLTSSWDEAVVTPN